MASTGIPHRIRFRPPWWGVALAVAGCVAGIALGHWQSGRAEEKRKAASEQKSETLRGELLARYTLFLQNRLYRGKPGYYVVQPLRLADDRHVLVLRGWSAVAAPPPTPRGPVVLEGVRRERLPRAYETGESSEPRNVRQNMSLGEFSAWAGLTLEPYVIEQHSALVVTQPPSAPDGLVRDWPEAEPTPAKHEAYAFQWYSLALLSVVLLLVLGVKREKNSS